MIVHELELAQIPLPPVQDWSKCCPGDCWGMGNWARGCWAGGCWTGGSWTGSRWAGGSWAGGCWATAGLHFHIAMNTNVTGHITTAVIIARDGR